MCNSQKHQVGAFASARVPVVMSLVLLLVGALGVSVWAEAGGAPVPGLHAYTQGHATPAGPPDRRGGPPSGARSPDHRRDPPLLPGPAVP